MDTPLERYRCSEVAKIIRLVQLLNDSEKWRDLANYLTNYRFPVHLNMDRIKSASDLLSELVFRNCTIGFLRDVLRDYGELHGLAFISDPEPLRIVEQPGENEEEKMISQGSELSLTCLAESIPLPTYQWYRDNTQIESGHLSVLTIPNFGEQNEGEYYCVVSRVSGTQIDSVTSNSVICSVRNTLPLVTLETPPFISKEKGSDVVFKIQVSCLSKCSLQWIKDNEILDGEEKSILRLKCVRRDQAGVYRCMARNRAGEIYSKPITLKIEKKMKCPPAKVALLIANANYTNHNRLLTPCNDVVLLSEKLKNLNFKVISLMNLNFIEMKSVINWFFQVLPPGSYTFFLFVGHGFQLCGSEFMMPVDCPGTDSLKMADCICDKFITMKAKLRKMRFLVTILDMCRELPNRNQNPTIYNERIEEYVYDPYHGCDLLCICSTSNHQSAYENPDHLYGEYIEHLSKYIAADKPLLDIVDLAHEQFLRENSGKIQKPTVFYESGGRSLKLTTPATGDSSLDMVLNRFRCLSKPRKLHFSSLNLACSIPVEHYRGQILNAVSMIVPVSLNHWIITFDVHPSVVTYEICPVNSETASASILNIVGLQKASSTAIIIKLSRMVGEDLVAEDEARLELDLGCFEFMLPTSPNL